MPEGPETHYIADLLKINFYHYPIKNIWFFYNDMKYLENILIGKKIEKIEARGKVLLIWFSKKIILYTHNQLYGKWYILNNSVSQKIVQRVLKIKIENSFFSAFLYSATNIKILNSQELSEDLFLNNMGPDVLNEKLTIDIIINRLMFKKYFKRQLGSILLDQSFVSGIGNYLRAEILWHAKLLAIHKPIDLSEEQQYVLCKFILIVSRLSYVHLKNCINKNKFFKVFRRNGFPCFNCSSVILKDIVNGRPFYWCKKCQC